MKSIIRLGVFLLVALMVVSPAISTHAQGNCYGVPEADCQLVTEAGANSAGFQQGFNMDYKLAVNFKGTSNGTESSGAFNINGNGVFGAAAAAAAGGDASSMMSALLFSNVINYDISGSTMPAAQKGSIEVRIVNGNAYFKADMMGGKWQYVTGAELQSLFTAMASRMSGAGAAAGGTGGAAGANPMSNPELLGAIMAAPNIPGVITGEAADGPEVDGQATRKVTYNLDLATLISAKEFRPVMKSALTQQAAGKEVTDAQIDDTIQKATAALKNTKLSVYVLVGSSDKITHGFGLSVAAAIDEATAKLLSSSGTSGSGEINATFDITFSKVGQAVTVEAPADATKFDMSMFGGASK